MVNVKNIRWACGSRCWKVLYPQSLELFASLPESRYEGKALTSASGMRLTWRQNRAATIARGCYGGLAVCCRILYCIKCKLGLIAGLWTLTCAINYSCRMSIYWKCTLYYLSVSFIEEKGSDFILLNCKVILLKMPTINLGFFLMAS